MNWEQDDIFLSKWLNNELSEEEKRAFETTEEGKEFMDLMSASRLIEPMAYDPAREFSKLQNRIQNTAGDKEKAIWQQTSFRLAMAASFALLISAIYVFSLGDEHITTGYLEQEIVILPDGSEVKLNASSTLSYDPEIWKDQRTLQLSGEAFFKVKKGSEFNVETRNGNVQVLGTSFNVKSRASHLQVVCYTGKVEVATKNAIKKLQPGHMIKLIDGEMVLFKQTELPSEPSWMNGITKLENEPLTRVLDELNHLYGLRIEYDQTLNHLEYTGSFPNQDIDAALKLVFDPLNIHYTYDQSKNELVILSLNP